MMMLFALYLSFCQIGVLAFGGGYAMIPLMQREFISVHQWLTSSEFVDIIAIAEITPGPVSVNFATYIGYKVAGIPGSTTATLGLITPSLIIILAIARLFKQFSSSPPVKAIITGIRPAVLALILTSVLVLGQSVLVEMKSVIITLTAFLLLTGGRMPPFSVIAVSAVLGLLLY